jgi:hypothetical protein
VNRGVVPMEERMRITKSQLVEKPEYWARHVVILGAGASVAAFPQGDASGRRLPTMDNLTEMLGLEPVLERGGVKKTRRNFENIYSELYEIDPGLPILREIEEIIYAYFSNLSLPETPTLYDHLMISLRPKDMVATFNWDPFLFDAWNRIKENVPVPKVVHLHGNVRLSYCPEHPVYGAHGMFCPTCDKGLVPSRLLYPVAMKNYVNDSFIKTEWEVLRKGLRQAKTLTIFGYGAPTTDKEAFNILNNAWDKANRLIERTEIIDIKDKEVLWKQWDPFIVRTYLDCPGNFCKSRLASYPRRTCEALLYQTFYGLWVEENPFPENAEFDELLSWVKPLVQAERNIRKGKNQGNAEAGAKSTPEVAQVRVANRRRRGPISPLADLVFGSK